MTSSIADESASGGALTADPGVLAPSAAAVTQARRRGRFGIGWSAIVLIAAAIFFLLPLYGSAVFALSTGKAFSLKPLLDALADQGFQDALVLSLIYATVTTILTLLVMSPTCYVIALRYPRLRGWLEFVSILPFVIPPIVLTLGLSQMYGIASPLNLLNSPAAPVLLIGGYFILCLPFAYRAIDNALRAVDVRTLTEAAATLGSGQVRTFVQVIVPSVRTGLVAAGLLAFTTAMGEFTLAALLGYATFPVYLENLNGFSPREASALVLVSFFITWIGVLALVVVGRRSPGARVVVGNR
jgi:putative spermidine/putrescine transport system permease protein